MKLSDGKSGHRTSQVRGGKLQGNPMPGRGYRKFAAGGAHYVYDSHTNGIVKVDQAVQDVLDDYFRLGRHELELAHPAISRTAMNRSVKFIEGTIQDGGLFQPLSAVRFVSALNPDQFQAPPKSGLSELTLNVTEQCNQSCSYCHLTYSRLSQPKRAFRSMTWDIARRSIDFFLAITFSQGPVNIAFFGGEPLLRWELIQKCLRYLRESHAGREIQARLISNATLLNRNIVEALIDFNVHLQVSLDGPQHIHDAARFSGNGRATYQQVYNRLAAIRALNANYFRNNIFLNCTFKKQNDILEVFRYFNEGMFTEVPVNLSYVTSSFPDRFSVSPENALLHEERVEQLIEMYLVALTKTYRFNYDLFWSILKGSLLLAKRTLGPEPGPSWPNGTCVPGVRRLFVTSNGTFYPCEKFCPEGWDIGNHERGIEFSKVQALFRAYADLCQETCQGCWAHRLCGLCYLSMVSQGQVDPAIKAKRCDGERDRIVKALRRFVYIWENEPPEAHNHPSSLHFLVKRQRSS